MTETGLQKMAFFLLIALTLYVASTGAPASVTGGGL